MYCVEAEGIEWDWFACDEDGHVALISSGGSGQVPSILLAHQPAIDDLLARLGIECDEHSWRRAAERGFFAFDIDVRGGPFRRLAKPKQPKLLSDLSEPDRLLVSRAIVRGCFARLRRLDCSRVGIAPLR